MRARADTKLMSSPTGPPWTDERWEDGLETEALALKDRFKTLSHRMLNDSSFCAVPKCFWATEDGTCFITV